MSYSRSLTNYGRLSFKFEATHTDNRQSELGHTQGGWGVDTHSAPPVPGHGEMSCVSTGRTDWHWTLCRRLTKIKF
ncbi:hypothetical protein EYF80_008975 [Liparis tanakae]|uniref:Uncharacterized protein n=1 Tax=Liparis tanakae TaxID=230148 RepID=A0A4Z2ISC0_9TELE|nr:hypothetical protein EYF80_008975 [Liparis tanakae]